VWCQGGIGKNELQTRKSVVRSRREKNVRLFFLANAFEGIAGFIYAREPARVGVALDPRLDFRIESLAASSFFAFAEIFSCVSSHSMKIVKVNWADPCFAKSGWMDKDDFRSFCQSQPARSTTIGILAHEDKKSIVILQTIGENTVADAVKISRASILDLKVVSHIKDIAFV
jgi:hypothetical protein